MLRGRRVGLLQDSVYETLRAAEPASCDARGAEPEAGSLQVEIRAPDRSFQWDGHVVEDERVAVRSRHADGLPGAPLKGSRQSAQVDVEETVAIRSLSGDERPVQEPRSGAEGLRPGHH